MHAHSRKPPSFRHDFSRRWGLVAFNLFAAIAVAACGGGGGGGNGGQQQQNNTAPTVSAGADQTITLPATASLTGSATDAQGQALTYQWSSSPAAGVTFASATSASTTATFSTAGTYTLTLTANDGSLSGTDALTVTVAAGTNTAPTVSAGADQTVTLPATATLSGSATDAEGNSLTYAWTSEPTGVTFADAAAASTTATFPAAGTYTLTLTANDGTTTGSDQLSVVVQAQGSSNAAPVVNAGANQTIRLPTTTAQLAGSATDDGLPSNTLTYAWSQTGGTAGVTFDNAASASAVATFPGEGAYTLTLTVSDGAAQGAGTVIVTVAAASALIYPGPDDDSTDPLHGWSQISFADAGMTEARLQDARDYALAAGGSGLIARRGQIVYSWGDIDTKYPMKSTAKSIGGMTLGLAMLDYSLDPRALAQPLLPSLGTEPPGNNPAWLDDITILQLATHSAGFRKDINDAVLEYQPGTTWFYSDVGLNWLADVLTQRFGRDLRSLMFERVFARVGMGERDADLTWGAPDDSRNPLLNGIQRRNLHSGMSTNVNSMARLGLLMLRGGVWANDERIVPQAFVDLVSRPPAEIAGLTNPEETGEFPRATEHYGVLWWTNASGAARNVPTDAYWGWGLGDSLIIVIPSLDLVIARAGPQASGPSQGRVFGDNDWTGHYTVLEPFLRPIVCATDSASAACSALP